MFNIGDSVYCFETDSLFKLAMVLGVIANMDSDCFCDFGICNYWYRWYHILKVDLLPKLADLQMLTAVI